MPSGCFIGLNLIKKKEKYKWKPSCSHAVLIPSGSGREDDPLPRSPPAVLLQERPRVKGSWHRTTPEQAECCDDTGRSQEGWHRTGALTLL